MEEAHWQQRSQLQWHSQGERNTRLFHKAIRVRGGRKNTSMLKDATGMWVDDPIVLKQMARNYFINLYADGPSVIERTSIIAFPQLNQNDRLSESCFDSTGS